MALMENSLKCEYDEKYGNNEQREDDVKHLKEWMTKKYNLLDTADEDFIDLVYASCECNLQIAKQFLDSYCVHISRFYKMYSHWDDMEDSLQKTLDTGIIAILPEQTPTKEYVLLISFFDLDPEKYIMENIFMCILMLIHGMRLRYNDGAKFFFIIDMKGFTVQHILRTGVNKVTKINLLGKALLKHMLKELHYVNLPFQNQTIINLCQLISRKAKTRAHFHKNVDCLKEYFPEKLIPREFGGYGPTMRELQETARKEILPMVDYIRRQRDLIEVDETKIRLEEEILDNDVFGVDGIFRKLEID